MILKTVKVLQISLVALILLSSCTTGKISMATVEDENIKSILEKSMLAHGGQERWQDIKQLDFNKWYALYKEDGSEELSVFQAHEYSPQEIRMSWEADGQTLEQKQVGTHFTKMVNGQIDNNTSIDAVKNSILASTFVVNVPFNIMGQGATLSYEGIQDFNGKKAHVLKAVYAPDKYEHHTTPDTWWHYIDTTNHICLGYKVKHLDHISLIHNVSWYNVDGFKLINERESYRVNDQAEILWTRAKYKYSDYVVN